MKPVTIALVCMLAIPTFAQQRTTRARPAADRQSRIEQEVAELKQAVAEQQRQIQQLVEELRRRDQSVQAAQEQARAAETAAQQAQSAVATAGAGNREQQAAVTRLGADVDDLKQNATATAVNLQEEQKRVNSTMADALKKIGPFSFSGDFRLRDEPFFGGPANRSQARNRVRFRLRVNANVRLNDDLSGGLALASGDLNDPISSNQTLNQYYTRKPFLLDRAFIVYTPHQFRPLTLTGGKMAYPWYRTELTWDNDLNPEGIAEKLDFKLEHSPVLKQVTLVGFQLPFAETAGVNFNVPNPNDRSIRQSAMYGGQLQTMWLLAPAVNFSAYAGFYNFHNPDPIAFSIATANASSPANGLLRIGGSSFQNSYQQVAVAFPVPTAGGGTTAVNSSILNAKLNSAFGLFDAIAQFDIKTALARWPVRVLGDYVRNLRACDNANNPIFVPAQPSNAVVTTSTVNGACDPSQRDGYWLEARFGRAAEAGDLQLAYTRMFIEREAVMSAFNFSDMRQNSNVSQHRMEVLYQAHRNVQFALTGLFGRPLHSTEPYLKRYQIDVIYKF